MTEEAGKYQGVERFQAREDVAAELDALGAAGRKSNITATPLAHASVAVPSWNR